MPETPFQKLSRAALAAVKAGDCDAAKINTVKALHRASTPHQRDIIYKIQGKVRHCEIKQPNLAGARRAKKPLSGAGPRPLSRPIRIQETYVNEDRNIRFSETGYYETRYRDFGELFQSLRREFGAPSTMYSETKSGDHKAGWIFSKRVKYDDSPGTYKRAVWIKIHPEDRPREWGKR